MLFLHRNLSANVPRIVIRIIFQIWKSAKFAVVNAIEAVKDRTDPMIILSAYRDTNNKTIIKVADNGYGVSSEVMEKIFIPFFSTKKNGSGIGLSLSKQIMMLHKGNIHVQSIENEGTVFLLTF